MKGLILIGIVLFFSSIYGFSEETANQAGVKQTSAFTFLGAFYGANQYGYGQGGFLPINSDIVSNLPYDTNKNLQRDVGGTMFGPISGLQAQAILSHEFVIPFLQMDNMLMKNNNLKLKLAWEISPVSTSAVFNATLTPLALMNISAGGKIGTGWNIGFNGLGRVVTNSVKALPDSFFGAVYRMWVSGALQFDTGAVIPGDWTHVLMFASQKLEYYGLTGVDDNTPWQWEADEGKNMNGWKLYGTYVIAYQMPLVVDTVGLMLETEARISHKDESTMASGGWGSDFILMTLSPLMNIKLDKNMDLTFLIQFINGVDYTDNTIGNAYFKYRKAESTYWSFYRLAFSFKMAI